MSIVINLKGQVMEEAPKTEEISTTAETAIMEFFKAVTTMYDISKTTNLKGAQFRDEKTGVVHSSTSVMRLVDRHINFIRASMGEYTPTNQPTNHRR